MVVTPGNQTAGGCPRARTLRPKCCDGSSERTPVEPLHAACREDISVPKQHVSCKGQNDWIVAAVRPGAGRRVEQLRTLVDVTVYIPFDQHFSVGQQSRS